MQNIKNFTPREIVSELDRYIIGQKEAKRAVAIAMRNRWRRQQVGPELKDEISPKNIIMIGPTGVGKTEIARRLAKLANAPFVKVEASKFTEVGYVGKDVESMIRELVDIAVNMVKEDEQKRVQAKAEDLAEERLLDLLLPPKPKSAAKVKDSQITLGFDADEEDEIDQAEQQKIQQEKENNSRQKMRKLLREGKLDEREVELSTSPSRPVGGGMPMVEVISTGANFDDIGKNIRDMLSGFMPKGQKRKKVKVKEAYEILKQEEAAKLIEMEEVVKKALELVEQNGMVFIDEIDKIASQEKQGQSGGQVSREGVQRDILPIVEGSRVNTKYGMVATDHVLFIAAGAFHLAKPSDLIPELQGRFPIRVELNSLAKEDFIRILTEPKNSLSKQYQALMETEKVDLTFSEDGLETIAQFALEANQEMENIGARRLHTILEKVLDEISFDASEKPGLKVVVDKAYVEKFLQDVIKDQDLSRYIL